MKTLQKTTLAMAIAAAPFFATHALEALDDDFLSNMTGQAGVTIETSLSGQDATTIGSITYTDTNTGATGEIGGGSLAIQGVGGTGNGISVSGGTWDQASGTFTYGGSFDRQTIDIDENGNLITQTQAISDFGGGVVASTAKEIKVGEVLLRADGQTTGGAQLASNLTLIQQSGNSQAHILNLTGGADQAESISNYEGSAHAINANLTNVSGDAKIAIVTKGSSRIAKLDVDALDGAVGIRNLSYGGGADGSQLMESTQVIWAVNGDASVAGSKAGIYIQGSDSTGTLTIGELQLGQNNIGSIQISNITQSGSIQRIYGH